MLTETEQMLGKSECRNPKQYQNIPLQRDSKFKTNTANNRSYKAYAYGDKAPDWLTRKPILAQFRVKDKYKAYRGKVQHYAEEEKSLWEDFRDGMIGTKEFVDRMRSTYMPDNFHNEIPQHRALGKSVDPEKVLEKAAGILNCDLD